MTKLPKLSLDFDEQKGDWALKIDKTAEVVKRFETKEDGTAGGVLKRALGPEGGSVKIHLKHGGIEEERTFPRSKDPRKSRG